MKNSLYNIYMFLFLLLLNGEIFPQNTSYVYSWYKYYEPVEGKIIGIWPHLNRWNDIQKLKDLKYRWGFNYITFWTGLGHDKFNMANQIGYSPATNIMYLLEPDYYLDAAQFENCWAYYLDEPSERKIPFNKALTMKTWLKNNFPKSLFVTSGYKRNSDLINYTNALADKILFSAYIHWWKFLGIWISWPVNTDQRGDWTDMKNLFGNKFSMTWISANSDLSEYNQLLGHAKNLGLQGIWLYQYSEGPEADDNNINTFCNAAAYSGFLQTKYQQVRDRYIDGVFADRQFVGPSYSSIPAVYNHSGITFTNTTVTNNRIDDYFAAASIIAGSPYYYILPASNEASFNSNNQIILKPGFHAQLGCEFRAYINKEKP
jgi:hypothetical protein